MVDVDRKGKVVYLNRGYRPQRTKGALAMLVLCTLALLAMFGVAGLADGGWRS